MKSSRFALRPTGSLGFLSQTFYATRTGDPKGYILKVGTNIAERKRWAKELHVFDRELAAYHLLSPFHGKHSPHLYYGTTADHGSDGLLLMKEIKKARNIDQIRGLEWKDLRSAVLAIAQVHAHFWNSPALKKAKGLPLHHYMRAHQLKQNLPRFLRWANLSDENKDLFSTLPDRVPSVLARLKKCPFTLVHGDLRSDNIFFQRKTVRFIDWGLSFVGCPAFDLARLAGGSSRTPLTLMQHVELFNLWHRELLRHKVRNYPSHEAWQDYRDAVLLTLTIPVTNAPTLAKFSARGHEMAKVITTRFIFASHQLGIL